MKSRFFRRFISLAALTSFFFVALTGIILFFVPQGRVAYWADWRIFGITKEEWTAIHINITILFLILSGFHIYYNWNAILLYLKNAAKKAVVFNREFSFAFLLTLAVVFGTYFQIPPLKTIIDFNDSVKTRHEEKYGSPPYGHAELSTLSSFTKRMGLDLEKSIKILKDKGLAGVEEGARLQEMAKQNKIAPDRIFEYIKDASVAASKNKSSRDETILAPASDPAMYTGLGRISLALVSEKYAIDLEKGLHNLQEKGIHATPEMTLKEIAEKSNIAPFEIFDIFRKE